MTGTEQTAGMLIDPAGACLPVKLEVERYGRRPVLVTANGSLPNGRYKLLCGAWLAAVVCIDGELEIADALAELRMSGRAKKTVQR